MSIKIEPGRKYLLDGKMVVEVLKPVNRSLTIFNVESRNAVESVEADRLKPLEETFSASNAEICSETLSKSKYGQAQKDGDG